MCDMGRNWNGEEDERKKRQMSYRMDKFMGVVDGRS